MTGRLEIVTCCSLFFVFNTLSYLSSYLMSLVFTLCSRESVTNLSPPHEWWHVTVRRERAATRSLTGGYHGRGGIRTLGTLSRTHTFQACALNHSATRPSIILPRMRVGDRALGTPWARRPLRYQELVRRLKRQRAGKPLRRVARRTGWDSNPRYRCRYTGFRDRLLQPLGHLSNTVTKNIHAQNGSQRAQPTPTERISVETTRSASA